MIKLDDLIEGQDRPKKKWRYTIVTDADLESIIKTCRSEHGDEMTAEFIRRIIKAHLPTVADRFEEMKKRKPTTRKS